MAVEVYMDEIETDAIGGFDRVMPGGFHFSITAVDEDGGKKGEMIVDMEVLRGTTSNQEGKFFRAYFRKDSDKPARKMMLALAIATGLTSKQQLDQHKANGTSPILEFSTIVGKQICANLIEDTYQGKTNTKISWDEIFHPCDKRANHIPLHVGFLNKAGIKLPEGRNPDGIVMSAPAKQVSPRVPPAAAVSQQQAANVDDLLAGV